MPNEAVQQGYFYGVLDVVYARMTQEETTKTKPTYTVPDVLASSIETTITPVYKEAKLHASNVTKRNAKRIDMYNVKLNLDKIPHAKQAEILGRKKDDNGVQMVSGNADPPYIAIGLAYTLDDGTVEYWWLYKGTFAELTKTGKTDGEKLEYQTPTIEGVFLRRQDNNLLAAIVDSADKEIPATVFEKWFDEVYEMLPAGGGSAPEETEEP